jgi:hypothetical protein
LISGKRTLSEIILLTLWQMPLYFETWSNSAQTNKETEMRFRETAKIQTVLAGGKIWFRRGTGYRITLANGAVKIYKAKELKSMSEADFVANVLELDVSQVTLLETADRKTPPRFAPKSKERAAELKARKDRIRKRAARKAARETVTVEIVPVVEVPSAETVENTSQRVAAEMGVSLVETTAEGETA